MSKMKFWGADFFRGRYRNSDYRRSDYRYDDRRKGRYHR
jgi:hypothetical protein